VAAEQLPQAMADCNEALRLRPGDGDALDIRGLLHLKMGDLPSAIADFDAALKAEPAMANSRYGRGLAKRRRGGDAGGEPDIAAARRLNPDIAVEYAGYGVRGSWAENPQEDDTCGVRSEVPERSNRPSSAWPRTTIRKRRQANHQGTKITSRTRMATTRRRSQVTCAALASL
jgi:tetratricopeptide (TPR) repeat protein